MLKCKVVVVEFVQFALVPKVCIGENCLRARKGHDGVRTPPHLLHVLLWATYHMVRTVYPLCCTNRLSADQPTGKRAFALLDKCEIRGIIVQNIGMAG